MKNEKFNLAGINLFILHFQLSIFNFQSFNYGQVEMWCRNIFISPPPVPYGLRHEVLDALSFHSHEPFGRPSESSSVGFAVRP